MMEELKYPIGKYDPPGSVTRADLLRWIDQISAHPVQLRKAVEGMSDEQLDIPYRPGGWTPRQVVHHLVDSHLNAYVRTKWILTEEDTTIKPYEQEQWTTLGDYSVPVEESLQMLSLIHSRWARLLMELDDGDFNKTYYHPEKGDQKQVLWKLVGLYAWHGKHHLAHITKLKECGFKTEA